LLSSYVNDKVMLGLCEGDFDFDDVFAYEKLGLLEPVRSDDGDGDRLTERK